MITHTFRTYFLAIYLLNRYRFITSIRTIFCNSLMHIFTNKLLLLPLLAASPPIFTPIASPIFVDLWRPANTKYIRHLNRPGQGGQNEFFSPYPGCLKVWSSHAEFFWSINNCRIYWYNVLGDNKINISDILQLNPILQGLFYSLLTLLSWKEKIMSPSGPLKGLRGGNSLIVLV